MSFKFDFGERQPESNEPTGAAKLKYEDIESALANLNFSSLKPKGVHNRSAPVVPSITPVRTPTYREIEEFIPGQAIRSKEFYFSQWIGRPFHVIVDESPDTFAVHNYYASAHFTFQELEILYKASPNALIIIHDHDIHSYCTPLSKCKEIPWKLSVS
jgi:hypothetical protein